MASHGIKRPGRHRRHGLHAASASTGTRAPTTCSSTPSSEAFDVGRRRARTTSTPTGSARWARACPGLTLAAPLQARLQAGHPRRELCATGSRGVPQRLLRRGLGRLRRRHGHRRREAEGLAATPGLVAGTARRTTARAPTLTAPAMFSLLAPAYAKKYGVDEDELKDVLARIAWKNHHNGARNPRAQFRKEVSKETIACSPLVAGPLGIFDCSGVADGSAAAIVVRAEDAHNYTDKPLYVKALSFVAGPAAGPDRPRLRLHDVPRGRRARPTDAYAPGRHHRPARRARHGRGARLLHARPSSC